VVREWANRSCWVTCSEITNDHAHNPFYGIFRHSRGALGSVYSVPQEVQAREHLAVLHPRVYERNEPRIVEWIVTELQVGDACIDGIKHRVVRVAGAAGAAKRSHEVKVLVS
jgi:hypothetical protein